MKPNCYCARCRQERASLPPSTPALAVHSAPEPTSLIDRIAGRVLPTAPVFGGGAAITVNARPSDGVDDPPDLIAAIQSRKGRK